MTTEPGALSRQPHTLKELQSNKHRLAIYALPTVNYSCQKVDIPGISLRGLAVANPNNRLRFPGTLPEFGELEVTFLVDQNLQNYLEIWSWIIGATFPEHSNERKNWVRASADSVLGNNPYPLHSDADIFILSTQNNVLCEVHFMDLFPVAISSLTFEHTTEEAAPLVASARFQYRSYQFRNRRMVE